MARSPEIGMGCTFGIDWHQGMWSETTLFQDGFQPNIALLELLAIVAVVETWAPQLARLIHDLAYPYNSESVNSCIPEENLSVQYHHIDEVINMVLTIGVCARGGEM